MNLPGRISSLRVLGGRRKAPAALPFVPQLTPSDCGAACLSSVLRMYGRFEELTTVREMVGFGRSGADAQRILTAAGQFGLRGEALKFETLEDLDLLPRGAILHWRFNHYVVLEGWTREHVFVLDPARGRRAVPLAEADRSLTGVALVFERTGQFEELASSERLWPYFRQLLRPAQLVSWTLVASVLVHSVALALPLFISLLVDRLVPRGEYTLVLAAGGGLAALILFHFVASLVRGRLVLRLSTDLDSRLTYDFLKHLIDLPYRFFAHRPVGDLVTRVNSNAQVREILTAGTLTTVIDGLLVSLYLVLILLVAPFVGVVVALLAVVRIGIYLATRRRYGELRRATLQRQAKTQSEQFQILHGIETLKIEGAEEVAFGRWLKEFDEFLESTVEYGRLKAWVESLQATVTFGGPLVVLWIGALQVVEGSLSLGTMMAISALAGGFLVPVGSLVGAALQLEELRSYLERIREVMTAEKEVMGHRTQSLRGVGGPIELDGVSFHYEPDDPAVLSDVSFVIAPKSFVAIVGPSGAGKSTLAKLIVGLYKPTSGSVRFKGTDLRDLDLRWLRRQIGMVPQDVFLFNGTIRSNIAFSESNMPLSSVIAAAKVAGIHGDITKLPLGYDTLLGEGGKFFSGGQTQRIALARALVGRPPILVLDEATSGVDAVTEASIHEKLLSLACTRVVISHRLSTICNADRIIVVDGGRVVETGTHEELRGTGGVYASMVRHQLQSGPDGERPRQGLAAPAGDSEYSGESLR